MRPRTGSTDRTRGLRRRGLAAAALVLAVTLPRDAAWPYQAYLPNVTVTLGDVELVAMVACTEAEHRLGLGHRPTLGADAAMLFVLPSARAVAFSMRDTVIPLSIAFLDEAANLRDVVTLRPGRRSRGRTDGAVRYAIEVRAGRLGRPGERAGTMPPPIARFGPAPGANEAERRLATRLANGAGCPGGRDDHAR